jgi:hypothetical protein
MSGRPIRLVIAAAASALAAVLAASAAQAGCYTCGYAGYTSYAPAYVAPCGGCGTAAVVPRVVYVVPRVVYAAPCGGCGSTYYASPVYRVDLGPTYTTPLATPADDDDYVSSRSYRHWSRYDDVSGYRARYYRYHLHRAARFSASHHLPVSYRPLPLHHGARPHSPGLDD